MTQDENSMQNRKIAIMIVGLVFAAVSIFAISSQLHEIITLLRILVND